MYTYYVAKTVDFQALAQIIAKIEKQANEGEIINIILLETGEIIANRNNFDTWEIMI